MATASMCPPSTTATGHRWKINSPGLQYSHRHHFAGLSILGPEADVRSSPPPHAGAGAAASAADACDSDSLMSLLSSPRQKISSNNSDIKSKC